MAWCGDVMVEWCGDVMAMMASTSISDTRGVRSSRELCRDSLGECGVRGALDSCFGGMGGGGGERRLRGEI